MVYIQLTRQDQTVYVEGRTQGYRMLIEVTAAQGVSPNIFVFLRQIVNGVQDDVFQNVASPADLQEYPVNNPNPDTIAQPPFYRLSAVDLVFRTQDLAEEAWRDLQNDVAQLRQSLNYMNNLAVQEVVDFGTPTSSSSSSSSG